MDTFFRLPHDAAGKAKIIDAIPDDWGWCSGLLRAPEQGYRNLVAKNTGWRISQYSRGPEMVSQTMPDVVGMLVERKLPEYLEFAEAGYESRVMPLAMIKQIVRAYVALGYDGEISFYRDCQNNRVYDNSARASFMLRCWYGAPIDAPEEGHQPARVKLSCHEEHGGTAGLYQAIVLACGKLGMSSYVPGAKKEKS